MSWVSLGFPCRPVGKESACSIGDPGSIPGLGRAPGEGMADHSSILAWKISWTEEPGGLQSIGSQRVEHDWVTNTYLHDHITGKRGGWGERENSISFYSAVLLGLFPLRLGQPFKTTLTIYRRPVSMLLTSWEQVYLLTLFVFFCSYSCCFY